MDEKTKEEMIGIIQEVISGFSYDYAGENGNIEEAWIQVMCRLASKEHNYNEGKYTKEQLDEFEKYMENKGIIEGYTKYTSISSQARKRTNAKLEECLGQGTLNYELCSEIKKYFNTELLKRRNDANIDYFRELVEQDSLSYDEYIEKARAQVEKITQITMDQYNTRFAQILGAYLSKVPMAPLQASKDGYPYKYMPYLKEQTADLHSEYGDFIDRKDDVGNQEHLNEKIQYLNKTYRNIDRETDVITFALEDDETVVNGSDERILGDIYISLDKAKSQAEEYGHSLLRELSFLAVHGFYHLLGYDHMTEEDEKVMFGKQKEVLEEYGITR